jgi:hypothetical protein
MQLYVDGAADSSGTRTALSNSNSQTFNTTNIGVLVRNTTSNFYSGTISEVATWTRTLSQGEVTSLASGLPASHLAPAHYWPLWGVDSPEPDIGTAAHTTGTLTGTTAVDGARVGKELLTTA